MAGVFITATGTGVGKTAITAGLLWNFVQHGLDAVAMKPVATGAASGEAEDLLYYKKALEPLGPKTPQLIEDPALLNPFCYPLSAAPAVAAAEAGETIKTETILQSHRALAERHKIVLVEGAGGLYVPITGTGYLMTDLIRDLKLPLVIVTTAGLGTINHTLMTVKCARGEGLEVKGIVLNRFPANPDPLVINNLKYIRELANIPIMAVVPEDEQIQTPTRVGTSKAFASIAPMAEKLVQEDYK